MFVNKCFVSTIKYEIRKNECTYSHTALGKKNLPEFNRLIKSYKNRNYDGNVGALKQGSRTND